jgi:hypothetical protein
MSSTDGRADELAVRFFADRLLPAAAQLRSRGARLLPGGPDPATATYYVTRPAGEEYVVDLDVPLAELLHRQWRDDPEFVALVGELSRLAQELRQRTEQSGEISPFIYAMF